MDDKRASHPVGRYAGTPVLLVTLLLAASPLAGSAAADADLWYTASLGGVPVGYVRERIETTDSLVVTTVESRLLVGRLGETAEVSSQQEWIESRVGAPLGGRFTSSMAEESVVIELSLSEGGVVLTKSSFGRSTERRLEPVRDLLFPAALARMYAERCRAAGDTCSYSLFDTDYERFGRADVRVEGADTLEIMGEPRDLTRMEVLLSLYPGVPVHEWRDDTGVLWREEIPSFGLVRERATREVATESRCPLDIMASSMIRTGVEIDAPSDVDEALYEITLDGGEVSTLIPEDERQTIEEYEENGLVLRVRRVEPKPGTTVPRPIEDEALQDYLRGTSLMQTWYPRVLGAAARSLVGTDGDSWAAARSMERWVYESVDTKGFGTAFASAREVADRRYGDCSEHAVLLAAMARAVGIPSKLVSGLTYAGGGFAYHMWVEVWTGNAWYALDPTLGRGSVDATHIKLAETAARDGNVADLSVSTMRALNRLNIKVLEYKSDGNTVAGFDAE